MTSIALVGAGPTALYLLKALLAENPGALSITIFEAQAEAGIGSPYRTGWNAPSMLANIASAEIPPVTETLLAWLQDRSDDELAEMGVAVTDLNDRTFVPRVALGRYLQSQFSRLVEGARVAGHRVEVRTGCCVTDVMNVRDGVALSWSDGAGSASGTFDHVVLATGHQWPSRQEARPGYFTSPWPATGLSAIPPTDIGIRGSSLTALDATITLALSRGDFVRDDDERLAYKPAFGTEEFRVTLMSRKGLLPEADFYFPLPHPPLRICTPVAIRKSIEAGCESLLDRAFDLIRLELTAVDPDYARRTALTTAAPEHFSEAYFALRSQADPFAWAEANLAEARRGHAEREASPWRDALLRMHEVIAAVAPHLDRTDFDRFQRYLKPVFVDLYAAVPHETIERVLALQRAGKLELVALGDDYRIDTRDPAGGARLVMAGASRWFPVFIEATGQKILGAIQFPFLSLIEQGIVRDVGSGNGERGLAVDAHFALGAGGLPPDRLFCVSLPFIMGSRPFAQGITSSRDMGEVVGRRLAAIVPATKAFDTRRAVA